MFELGESMRNVWAQAISNHHSYSRTGDDESDVRFLTLGLAGEAGELANFVKKRWRDGELHDDDIRKEIADVCAYAFMLAARFDMSPRDLLDLMAHKQQVFVEKMKALGK
jgi:NTP pyrophosphatase (non-canonical NTP hydrolase)